MGGCFSRFSCALTGGRERKQAGEQSEAAWALMERLSLCRHAPVERAASGSNRGLSLSPPSLHLPLHLHMQLSSSPPSLFFCFFFSPDVFSRNMTALWQRRRRRRVGHRRPEMQMVLMELQRPGSRAEDAPPPSLDVACARGGGLRREAIPDT